MNSFLPAWQEVGMFWNIAKIAHAFSFFLGLVMDLLRSATLFTSVDPRLNPSRSAATECVQYSASVLPDKAKLGS